MQQDVRAAAALIAAILVFPLTVTAQTPAAPEKEPGAANAAPPADAAEAQRKRLEEEIRRDMGRSTVPRAPEARIAAQGTQAAQAGGSPVARLLLLPDISAIGSAALAWEDQTNKPAFAFEELELAFQAVVDPYARADIFVAFSDEGAEIEEAFVTTLALPAGLQLEAGKFFAPFGRLNQTHPHVWEFVDAPLAQRLLAEESLGGAGLSVAWLAPLPWFAELHLAGQSTAPGEEDEPRLTGVARLAQFFPLAETATLGVGLSAARRDEARSQFRDLAGGDVYLKWRPLASRSYVTFSGELYGRRFVGVEDVSEDFDTGYWAQVFGRFGPYAGAGVRWEQAPLDEGGDEERLSALFGWFPSEFQRLRLQVSYDRLPGGEDGVSGLVQVEFGIGAHGAHPF